MNHASGSALQKVSFVLVLFIAAAAGYLVVRERLRADRLRADKAAVAAQKENILHAVTNYQVRAAATNKAEYAPLRDRVVTNTVRVPSNGSKLAIPRCSVNLRPTWKMPPAAC